MSQLIENKRRRLPLTGTKTPSQFSCVPGVPSQTVNCGPLTVDSSQSPFHTLFAKGRASRRGLDLHSLKAVLRGDAHTASGHVCNPEVIACGGVTSSYVSLFVAWIVSRVDESGPSGPDRGAFHDCLLVLRASEMDGARGFCVVAARGEGLQVRLAARAWKSLRDSHFPTAPVAGLRLHLKWRDDPLYGYILRWLDRALRLWCRRTRYFRGAPTGGGPQGLARGRASAPPAQ